MSAPAPSRTLERQLLTEHRLIAGMDEVGRGALAGPVSVGVVVVDADTGRLPAGLRDSKLLSPDRRERLCAPIHRWCRSGAVGHASAEEIDTIGIVGALRLAGHRALAQVSEQGYAPQLVLLDGVHDWLSPAVPQVPQLPVPTPSVNVQIKGDLRISSIAAASVLAKTERDRHMCELHEDVPAYAWRQNKGYSAAAHIAALRDHGPSPWHRRSWSLPGLHDRVQQPALFAE